MLDDFKFQLTESDGTFPDIARVNSSGHQIRAGHHIHLNKNNSEENLKKIKSHISHVEHLKVLRPILVVVGSVEVDTGNVVLFQENLDKVGGRCFVAEDYNLFLLRQVLLEDLQQCLRLLSGRDSDELLRDVE